MNAFPFTNDLKKGTRIRLRNGWEATLCDNRKGNTRLAMVEGYVKEAGSVYAHDIVSALVEEVWVHVLHTEDQRSLRRIVERS